MRLFALFAVPLLVMGGVCAAPGYTHAQTVMAKKPTYKLRVTLTAPECDGGYAIEGASVIVRDQNNRVIGSATTSSDVNDPNDIEAFCKVRFAVKLPKVKFYQMDIGTHGAPAYSFTQLQKKHWKIALSLN